MAVVLNVEHLQKSYRKKIILKDINFQIHDSSIVALIGANGAGKTTLINTILKLIPKDTGEIQFSTDKWKHVTGVMMQDNLVLDRINVKEIINLTRSYFQNPLSYENLIGISGLKEVENTFISQLSGGQKRHLSFALALAGDPKILFLDEPTVGMDSNARNDFWKKIANLKQNGKSVFVTSHYLKESENIADHFLILQDKNIAFDGSLEQLRKISGKVLVEFDSKLSSKVFTNFPSVISINQTNHHFQIITNDANELLSKLNPFLKTISNLSVNQSSLDALLLNYQEKNND